MQVLKQFLQIWFLEIIIKYINLAQHYYSGFERETDPGPDGSKNIRCISGRAALGHKGQDWSQRQDWSQNWGFSASFPV